jgi:ribonuclease VapC
VIVDTSAIIALVREEPEAPSFGRALAGAVRPRISAANWVEAALVAEGRDQAGGAARFDRVMAASGIEVVGVTPDIARRARDAWQRFGKGRHPAGLNFGDCFSYALAAEFGEPLLFKGDDFSKTDVKAALAPHA